MRTLVLTIAILFARTVHADGDDGPKSEALALGLAISGTAIGPSLVTLAFDNDSYDSRLHAESLPMLITGCAAIVLGPSLGNWYAGKMWSTGLGLRLAGAGVFALGANALFSGLFQQSASGGISDGIIDLVVAAAGAGMIVAGTALDLRESVVTTRAYNREHHRALAIAPLVGPISGLSLAGSF